MVSTINDADFGAGTDLAGCKSACGEGNSSGCASRLCIEPSALIGIGGIVVRIASFDLTHAIDRQFLNG